MPRPVVLLSVLVLLSACGGGTPDPPKPKPTPDPVAQVRAIAPKVISTAGGYELCFENSTDRFIRAVYKGDRDKCRNMQDVIGPGKPTVLDAKVSGTQAIVKVAYEGSQVKGPFGTLTFVREGDVWKLDKLGSDFARATAIVSVRALSSGALSVPEVQTCVAKQTLKLSDARLRKYVPEALRLVNKCPKQVAIYVAEEIGLQLRTEGFKAKYVDCMQTRLEAYMVLTEIAPRILIGADAGSKDFGEAAVSGLIKGIEPECRRYR